MHRTIVRLYPWKEGQGVEVLSDSLVPVSKARALVCKADTLAKANKDRGKTYLLGENGVYEFERVY